MTLKFEMMSLSSKYWSSIVISMSISYFNMNHFLCKYKASDVLLMRYWVLWMYLDLVTYLFSFRYWKYWEMMGGNMFLCSVSIWIWCPMVMHQVDGNWICWACLKLHCVILLLNVCVLSVTPCNVDCTSSSFLMILHF